MITALTLAENGKYQKTESTHTLKLTAPQHFFFLNWNTEDLAALLLPSVFSLGSGCQGQRSSPE
jgi:hypothetical protein